MVTPARLLSGMLGSVARNFSSKTPELLELKFPTKTAKKFSERIADYHTSFGDNISLKPLNKKSIQLWGQNLQDTLKQNDPHFLDYILESHEKRPLITSITNLPTPELKLEDIPRKIADLKKQNFIKTIRPAEIFLASIVDILGIEIEQTNDYQKFFDYLVPLEEYKKNISSFQSEKTLKWHIDGWKFGGTTEHIALFCVANNQKNTITEIITTNQITDYFINNGRQDLLDKLAQDYSTGPSDLNPIGEQHPILDEKGNINYASYGRFQPVYSIFSTKLGEEIKFLEEALKTITPTLSERLDPGKIVLLNNKKTIHQKKVGGGSEQNPSKILNTKDVRVVIRVSGEEKDNNNTCSI